MAEQWVVHPNRYATEPGTGDNGRYRSVSAGERPPALCRARVALPPALAAFGDAAGSVTFEDSRWRLVVCGARTFAAKHSNGGDVLPPFGFQMKGRWMWWDGTTTDTSILDGPDAVSHVRRYLHELFPGSSDIEVSDRR